MVFDLRQFLNDGLRLARAGRQRVVNLLAIAIKFAPGGQVTLSANMTGAMDLAIHVADTGCGVPASQLEQVPALPPGGERFRHAAA